MKRTLVCVALLAVGVGVSFPARLTARSANSLRPNVKMQKQSVTYYVALGGDDSRPGTAPHTAWRSLKRASRQTLRAGDRLLLRGGETFAGSLRFDGKGEGGTRERPITIGAFGPGRAVIESPDTAVEARSMPGVIVRDLIVRGTSGAKGKIKRETVGVRIVNALSGAKRLLFARVENVEASGFGEAGIAVTATPPDNSQSGFEGVEIIGCTAHGNVYNGIRVGGVWDEKATTYAHRDVTVRDCAAYDNVGDPDYTENWSGNGIFVEDVDGALVEGCKAWNNGALCNAKVGGPVGIWAATANRVTIQHCHSHHNRTGRGLDGGGFDLDGGVTNSVMQYNLSHDNDGAGYLLYTYKDSPHTFHSNAVRFCVSRNDGRKNGYAAVYVGHHGNASGVRDIEVYGNVLENGPTPDGTKPPVLKVFSTRSVRFENNVFIARGVPLIDADPDQPGLVFARNVYRAEGDFLVRSGGREFRSLADWRATGAD